MVRRFNIDAEVVRAAIAEVEARTTAEIRVAVRRRSRLTPEEMARKMFQKFEMDKTRLGNGILIVIEPEIHRITLYGGHEAYSQMGAEIEAALKVFTDKFKKGEFTTGIAEGVRSLAAPLAAAFPLGEGEENPNELADELIDHNEE